MKSKLLIYDYKLIMPVHLGRDTIGPYYRWGTQKKYYYVAKNKKSREIAKNKAIKQGQAIENSK